MIRIAVLFTFFLAACDVGVVPINGGNGADGNNGGGDGSGSGSGNGCVDATTPGTPHLHASGGTSNAGLNCLANGCHGTNPQGPQYTFAGTLYTTSDATAPKPGATVKVVVGGTEHLAVTDQDGNFYGTQAITFPASTNSSSCPNIMNMVTPLQAGSGGQCNQCHTKLAGAQAPPMYLP
jgi:hypothetical protein